jgi:hypothetical protein
VEIAIIITRVFALQHNNNIYVRAGYVRAGITVRVLMSMYVRLVLNSCLLYVL